MMCKIYDFPGFDNAVDTEVPYNLNNEARGRFNKLNQYVSNRTINIADNNYDSTVKFI